MPGQFSLKPWMNAPLEQNVGQDTNQFFVWVQSALNQLISLGNAPPSQGLQSLQNNIINPTSGQIASAGSRMSSVTTAITYVFTANSVQFFWDGTNGSTPLFIGRDDGTVIGPVVAGSGLTVTGLTTNTTYNFYAYWDEALGQVVFAVNKAAVGVPPIAYNPPNFNAAQTQIMRGHIPLGALLVTTGVTPVVGGGSGSGGSGGGGAGGGINRGGLKPNQP